MSGKEEFAFKKSMLYAGTFYRLEFKSESFPRGGKKPDKLKEYDQMDH